MAAFLAPAHASVRTPALRVSRPAGSRRAATTYPSGRATSGARTARWATSPRTLVRGSASRSGHVAARSWARQRRPSPPAGKRAPPLGGEMHLAAEGWGTTHCGMDVLDVLAMALTLAGAHCA